MIIIKYQKYSYLIVLWIGFHKIYLFIFNNMYVILTFISCLKTSLNFIKKIKWNLFHLKYVNSLVPTLCYKL
jgi:hypothetical protein